MTEQTLDIMGLEEVEIENASIDEIESENINLIFIGIDQSSSMIDYIGDMKKSLKEFKEALINSKESEEILIARANFNDMINIGGYKKIQEFDEEYDAYGMTSLYDVIIEGKEKLVKYIEYLKEQGMRVKAVFSIFSDGEDTSSKSSFSSAKQAIEELNKLEITTAFISFGNEAKREAKDLDFKNILTMNESSSELRKAFNCLSKSVIESSKSVLPDEDDFFTV